MSEIPQLLQKLEQMVDSLLPDGVAVAFSGGVDSAVLLEVCSRRKKIVGGSLDAVTFQTKLHPPADISIAQEIAHTANVPFHIIEVDEFSDTSIINNPIDRCYHCKKLLFTLLKKFAVEKGDMHCLDGTNFDDLHLYRPGVRALGELKIISPLAQLGFHKNEIREVAGMLGLACAEKPSTPCLATRLPYNVPLDPTMLMKIDQGEIFLRSIGFETVRLRVHGEIARIEILPQQFFEFMLKKDEIITILKEFGFYYITLDLEGFRSGSMDIGIHVF